MSFATLTYAIFLAGVFLAYHALSRHSAQNILIVVASYVFYAWWDWRFAFLMLWSSIVDYTVGWALGRTEDPRRRRYLLWFSLASNLGLLGFFKYYGFFVESFAAALTAAGFSPNLWTLRVILPVGISFYTFQTLSYTIDVYRKEMRPTRDPVAFLAFVSFFPQLVAGPIERARHLLPQFSTPRRFDYQMATSGMRLVLWGLFKKLVIADNLAPFVDAAYGSVEAPGTTGPVLAIATVLFALQIYCDFSGYSDIAIGSARLFGIELMRNFAYPYFSRSVAEFWRRWHISLSTWFRDYVYIPLGGSRQGALGYVFAVVVTFTVSGLWHGAAWTFVIWGFLNGVGFLPEAFARIRGRPSRREGPVPGGDALLPSLRTGWRMLATFLFINATWVFFRAETVGDAFAIFRRFGLEALRYGAWGEAYVLVLSFQHLLPILLVFAAIEWLGRRHMNPLEILRPQPRPIRWLAYTAIVWTMLLHGAATTGPFIYFQF